MRLLFQTVWVLFVVSTKSKSHFALSSATLDSSTSDEIESVYSVGITIDLNDKHFFEIKHSSLPLAFEHATIFCHTNRIFDKRCPTQIMSKIFSRNSLQYSQQNIESILANGYFTLEQKLQAYKLQIDFAGEIEKYELLKLINNGDCYSTKVDEQNAMRRDTISKAQLTHAQIEFNDLFGRSSFGQQSLKVALKCFEELLAVDKTNAIFNFNYGAILRSVGNDKDSIKYFSAAANQKFFPAAIALCKSSIGSFDQRTNRRNLHLAYSAARTTEQAFLVKLRNVSYLPNFYMSERDYIYDLRNSVQTMKSIIKNDLPSINLLDFQQERYHATDALSSTLEPCAHHNPHTDMVIEAKTLLSTIMGYMLPLGANTEHFKLVTPAAQDAEKAATIRVGFISSFFRQHSVAKYTCPLMRKLKEYYIDKRKAMDIKIATSVPNFFVVAIGIGSNSNPNTLFQKKGHNVAFKFCRESTNYYMHAEDGASRETLERIKKLHLDVIIYPEIGLDPTVYMMSLARLAPVQISHLGNLVTHGIPTIDYVVMSMKFFPGPASERAKRVVQKSPFPLCTSRSAGDHDNLHFAEKVICFKTTALYLEKPNITRKTNAGTQSTVLLQTWKLLKQYDIHVPPPVLNHTNCQLESAQFEIPKCESILPNENLEESNGSHYDHVYLFPHNPAKYSNGDRDYIFEDIVTKDPHAKLVFLETFRTDAASNVQNLLKERWRRKNLQTLLSTTKNRSRFVWLPYTKLDSFVALGKLASVVLDVCPNGMGVSAVEMLAAGVPFVSTPYCQNVARLSQGMYETIGVTGMITRSDGEFLDLAFRIANDLEFRREKSRLILGNIHFLFNNADVVEEWVEVLTGVKPGVHNQHL